MKFRHLLVVDDSDADLLYTRIIIEAAGVAESVLTFGTAIEALAHLRNDAASGADLVLLDINMPEMNGFEFLDAYQPLFEATPGAPMVVMLTSSPDPADHARALSYACVKSYVIKPLTVPQARALLPLLAGGA